MAKKDGNPAVEYMQCVSRIEIDPAKRHTAHFIGKYLIFHESGGDYHIVNMCVDRYVRNESTLCRAKTYCKNH